MTTTHLKSTFTAFAALLILTGCPNDPTEDIYYGESRIPGAGSVYRYTFSKSDTTWSFVDSVIPGSSHIEGKTRVISVARDMDVDFPERWAFHANGDVSHYQLRLIGEAEWHDHQFGSRQTKIEHDSVHHASNGWQTWSSITTYRDTILKVAGVDHAGIKEESSWESLGFRHDGVLQDSASGMEHKVWIPSIGFWGLKVGNAGAANEHVERLTSYELK
jgi:hypothetical protein